MRGALTGIAVSTLVSRLSRRVVRSSRTRLATASSGVLGRLLCALVREIKSVLLLLGAVRELKLLLALASGAMVLVNVEAARRMDRFASGVVNQTLRSPASAAALLRRMAWATEERKAWGRVLGDLFVGSVTDRARVPSSLSEPRLVHHRVQHFRKTLCVRRVQRLIRAGRAPAGDDPGSDSEYWSEDEEYYDTVMQYETTYNAPDLRVGCWRDVVRARTATRSTTAAVGAAASTVSVAAADAGGGGGDREHRGRCEAARRRRAREVRLLRPPAWGKGAISTRTSSESPAPGCGPPFGVGSATVYSVHHEVFEGTAYEGAGELLLHRGSAAGRSCVLPAPPGGARAENAGADADAEDAAAGTDVWLLAPERPMARFDLSREYSAHAAPLHPAPSDLRAGDPPLVTLDEVERALSEAEKQIRGATVDDGAGNAAVAALVEHHELERQLYFNRVYGLCPPSGRRRRALVAHLYSRSVGLLQLSERRAAREALNTDATNRRIVAFLGLSRPLTVSAGAGAARAGEEYAHEAQARRDPRYAEALSKFHATGDGVRGVFRVAAESYYAVASAKAGGEGERSAVEDALVARGRRRRVVAALYALAAIAFGAHTARCVLRMLYLHFRRARMRWAAYSARGGTG